MQKSRIHTGKSNRWNVKSRQRLANRGKTANLEKGTPAAQKSPIAGPFETNQNALEWTLESPGNQKFKVRNLSKFIRDNPGMFDGTAEQARAGLMQVRRSIQGKTKRGVSQWKGWRILEVKKPEINFKT